MGGEMGVSSAPGVGSSFWFTARLTPQPDPLSPALRPLPSPEQRVALVADGLPASAEALARALRHEGWRVRTAGSADGVRAVIADPADPPPELMLVDLDLPGLDGRTGLDRLRDAVAAVSGRRPRCIPLARRESSPAMADGEVPLLKPVTPRQLARRLAAPAGRLSMAGVLLPVDPEHAAVLDDGGAAVGQGLSTPATAVPAVPDPTSTDTDEAWLRRHRAGTRVLLVEDNPVNQEVARELLQRAGLSVSVADDGQAALARLRQERFALVLMDVQMPGMDGLSATRALRRMPACEGLPVLAMTANAFGEDRAECLAAGMDDHVAKPVDPRLLYATVRRWLTTAGADPT
jgi:CheY-like chemotaxis protein